MGLFCFATRSQKVQHYLIFLRVLLTPLEFPYLLCELTYSRILNSTVTIFNIYELDRIFLGSFMTQQGPCFSRGFLRKPEPPSGQRASRLQIQFSNTIGTVQEFHFPPAFPLKNSLGPRPHLTQSCQEFRNGRWRPTISVVGEIVLQNCYWASGTLETLLWVHFQIVVEAIMVISSVEKYALIGISMARR